MLASIPSLPSSGPRVLVLLAHPGHELAVHGWIERFKPLVLLLTDGSSRPGVSVQGTTQTIRALQGRTGNLFARFTDRGFLQALWMRDHDRFVSVAEEVADLLAGERIDLVVGAAAEGLQPGADVARLILDAAAGIVSRRLRHLRNYEFSLLPEGPGPTPTTPGRVLQLNLEGESWERKRRALLHTQPPSEGVEAQLWRGECLRLAQPWKLLRREARAEYAQGGDWPGGVPTIRLREHLWPLGERLRLRAAGRAVA